MNQSIFLLIGAIVIILAVGLYFRGRTARAREYDRLREQADLEILQRLEAVAAQVGGTVVDGTVLQTPAGRLVLVATRAPKHPEVDVAKFIAPLAVKQQLTLIPVQDAAKALQTKNLRPVTPDDPAVAADYKLLASDDAFGRKVAAPPLIQKMRDLDKAVGSRSRLHLAPSGATVLVARGLSDPKDLKAFYEGSVAVLECLRGLAGA
jgi:hypothetical protein